MSVQQDINSHTPWFSFISAIGFVASLVYGAWALNQSQLATLKADLVTLREDTIARDTRIVTELTRREVEIKTSIAGVQAELDRRRTEFANIKEYNEFRIRLLDEQSTIRDQIKLLEGTRPTTGELSAVSNFLKDQVGRIEERLRILENRGR